MKIAVGEHRRLACTWVPTYGVTVNQEVAPISCLSSGWLLRGGEGRQRKEREGAGREEAGSFARLGAEMAD